MPIQYINTGSSPNKGDGDTLKRAFWKINQNFEVVSASSASKDAVGEVISNPARQRGIAVTYNSRALEANFLVNIASPTVFGGVMIGSGITYNTSTGMISVFDGNYNNLTNIPQALGSGDSPTFNNLHLNGDLHVTGNTTVIDTTQITTHDLLITLADNSLSAAASHGAGIYVNGPDIPATITYNSDLDSWDLNKRLNAGYIYSNGSLVVTSNSLGDIVITNGTISTRNTDEDLVLTPNGAGNLVLNKVNTVAVAGTIFQGTAYDGIDYTDTPIRVDADVDSYSQMIMQNHNSGTNASTDLIIMNDQGDSFNNIIDIGINSSNYYNPSYTATQPGDGYIFTNGGNLVIGAQSGDKGIVFHGGGTGAADISGILDTTGWHFTRPTDITYSSRDPLFFSVTNNGSGLNSDAEFTAENNVGSFIRLGIKSSTGGNGNIQPNDSFIYPSGVGQTLHIGNNSTINFYANLTTGYQGAPTLALNAFDENAILDGNFLPYENDTYTLGTSTAQWSSLYLSNSLYFNNKSLSVDQYNRVLVNNTPILGAVTFNAGIISTDVTSNILKLQGTGAIDYSSIQLTAETEDITVKGNFIPSVENNYGLGEPYARWRGVWLGDDGIQFADGSGIATGVVTDIIPSLNDTYNLGAPGAEWANLYVSSATIYIGGKSLSIDTDNNLTINGSVYAAGGTGNGYVGSQGSQGELGYVGSAGLDSIVPGYTGSQGELGYTGSQGQGLIAAGTTSTSSLLPTPYLGNTGDVYFVADTTSIWVWNGSSWVDNGSYQGPQGYVGSAGTGNSSVVQSDTSPIPANTSTLWYDTVSGRSYVYFDSNWVDASPAPILDLSTVTQHILPGADLTYDLGSPTQQWRSLYVGTATIFIGGVPISVDTTTNTLQVGAVNTTTVTSVATEAFVLSQTTSSLVNGAHAAILGTDGKLTIPSELSSEVGTGDVVINANDGTLRTWTFGSDGGLTFPIGNKFFGNEIMTSDYSGNTVIHGNQHITGNLQVDGVFTFTGTATVISVSSATFYGTTNGFGAFYAGVVGYTPLPVTVAQFTADYNDYVQNNFQNLNNGVAASTEWVATADNGNDTNNYIDMGIASSQWNGSQSNSVGTAADVNDSWIYVQGNTLSNVGGNLIVGTIKDGKAIKMLAGSNGASSIVAEFDAGGLTLSSGSTITFPDGSVQTSAVSSTGTVVLQTLNVTSLSATSITLNGTPITGERGYTGSVGTGYVGSRGANGYTGSAGSNGTSGSNGYTGSAGTNGTSGSNGYTGSAGTNGYTGSVGTFAGSTSAQVQFTNTTASTSTTTGALVVTGGVGVGGTVTANKFVGDGSSLSNVTVNVAGNILGTGTNVTLQAGNYSYLFDNAGTLTMPANGDIVMTGTNATIQTGGAITAGYNSPSGGTAFIAGNAAVNNIALGYQPTSGAANMAIRDLSTVSTYMYFDAASNTTSTASQFVFRSSSAYTTWAKIDQYGVNQPTRPAFRVYGAGTTNNLTTTANTNGILNGNNFAVDYQQGTALTTSTGIFTAPVAGLYSVHLVARVSNTASAQIAVVKNYAGTSSVQAMWECGANCTANHFGVSSIVKLAAGDTLVIKVLLGQINFDTNDSWAVAYIG